MHFKTEKIVQKRCKLRKSTANIILKTTFNARKHRGIKFKKGKAGMFRNKNIKTLKC